METNKEIIPLKFIRKKIAETVTNSKMNIPHFYVEMDMEMTKVIAEQKNWDINKGKKPTLNHYILKAVAMALKKVPEMNVSYSSEGLVKHKNINIGFALAMDEGMIIPVIRDADKLQLKEIALRAREFKKRAMNKKLLPQDYTGGTFTVSNMGMMGVKSFMAIIPPPQSAILAVGCTEVVPRWIESSWKPVSVSSMILSIDHRVADGALAARFMNELKNNLENPVCLAE